MAYTNLSDLFKDICDAIRSKKGTTGTINHQDIPSEIESIETGADVSGVTAKASDVRNDKYFVRSDGTLLQGSMTTVTKPSPSITVNPNGLISSNYSMSSGYVAEGSVAQTHYLSSSDDSDFVAGNIMKGAEIFGVSGTAQCGFYGMGTCNNHVNICDFELEGLNGRIPNYLSIFNVTEFGELHDNEDLCINVYSAWFQGGANPSGYVLLNSGGYGTFDNSTFLLSFPDSSNPDKLRIGCDTYTFGGIYLALAVY